MPDDFLNPYHFVPLPDPTTSDVTKDLLRQDPGPTADEFRKGGASGRLSHAAYAPNTLSGRIVVKLTTETPLVVGGEQDKDGKGKNDYTIVEPYRFKGETAIPATSLRGMLSSIVEAASQSAMRVFHDKKPVSYRQTMGQALSAIGRIEEVRTNDTWSRYRLRPLVLPYFEFDNGTSKIRFRRKHGLWAKAFSEYANLRCYVGEYPEICGRDRFFGYQQFMEELRIRDDQVLPIPRHDTPFYMKVSVGGQIARDGKITWAFDARKKGSIVVSQRSRSREILNAEGINRRRNQPGYDSFIPGFLRVLGGEDRDMSKSKEHELFIPFPEAAQKRSTLPITRKALETFFALANERSDDDGNEATLRERKPYLPFVSDPQMRQDRDDKSRVRLREGQLVFFDIDAGGNGDPVVSAISFSQIWRGMVEKDSAGDAPDAHIASLGDFFGAINKELLPFSSKRNTVSPAEWLFGFVSADGKPSNEQRFVAYASRVRISTGRMATAAEGKNEGLFLQEPLETKLQQVKENAPGDKLQQGRATRLDGMVRLKTLGSPKPPSPQLYFYDKGTPTAVVPKEDLKPGTHWPQGRKFYLHQDKNGKPWETKLKLGSEDEKDQARLRNAVKPIKDGTTFWFHIDFDNLSEAELGLLCFALQPSANFRHKLGMGKGIGLGTVHLEPQALCLVNRQDRYGATTDVLTKERYSEIILSPNVDRTKWPERFYKRERIEAGGATSGTACADHRVAACAAWIKAAYPDALNALLKIGEGTRFHPKGVPVHTPLAVDQWKPAHPEEAELKTFKWFAHNGEHLQARKQNDGKSLQKQKKLADPQQLAPISICDQVSGLPTPRRNAEPVDNPAFEPNPQPSQRGGPRR